MTMNSESETVDFKPFNKQEPGSTGVHRLFERQAERTPHAVAVSFENLHVTYSELNGRANQLARYLQSRGVGPDVLVGLHIHRSVELIVGILGVLKAGGAYLPLDPDCPSERMQYMLKDADAPILLTQQSLAMQTEGPVLICLDTDWNAIALERNGNLNTGDNPDNLAYVIYTSGSTGNPKGVLVTHYNIMRLMSSTEHWFNFRPSDVWTLFHSQAFDFSVWEIWGALLYGGRLVIVPYLLSRSPEEFYSLLNRERVTVLNQTPSAFRQLMQVEGRLDAEQLALRYVIFGGEALDLQSLKPWFDRHGDSQPQLVNMYGITETTVHVTYRPITTADVHHGAGSIIGVPIPDLEVYVLDTELKPVSVGVPGELYVGGAGLARGYLNRPELTADRFIVSPFGTSLSSRLYRTGDIVRRLTDGDLEYLGRVDSQVKVRGFRIELGEIESALMQHQEVVDAAVLANEDNAGNRQLVAYLITRKSTSLVTSELRVFLRKTLPEYMIPERFIMLDRFPLTVNCKVDRIALPGCVGEPVPLGEAHAQPQSGIETTVASIWMEVLGIDEVSRNANFFDIGGNSIRMAQVHCKLRMVESFDTSRLTVTDMFQYPTINSLAQHFQQIALKQGSYAHASQLPAFDIINDRVCKQREAMARRKKSVKGN